MNRFGLTIAACACGLLAHGVAAAEDTAAAPSTPDMIGVWTGSYKTLRWAGPAEGSLQFRVIEQDGPNLKVEKSWKLGSGASPGSVHGELLTEAAEPLVGVIGFNGEDVYFAEEGDGGVYTGRLADPDTLELVYFEAGEQATAYRTVLHRSR